MSNRVDKSLKGFFDEEYDEHIGRRWDRIMLQVWVQSLNMDELLKRAEKMGVGH